MFKGDVIKWVSREKRLPQELVQDVLEATHKLIQEELRSGRDVVFPGFGTFYPSKRQGGTIKDIQTGEPREYPARTVAAFRAGEGLKRAVAGKGKGKKK